MAFQAEEHDEMQNETSPEVKSLGSIVFVDEGHS